MKTVLKALFKIMRTQKAQQEQLDEIQDALQLLIDIKTKELENN